MIQRAAGEGVELLCFPETHLAGYRVGVSLPQAPCDTQALGQARTAIAAACRDHSIGAIVGTETPNGNDKPFNSAVVFDRQGRPLAVHHKSRLTARRRSRLLSGNRANSLRLQGDSDGLGHLLRGLPLPRNHRALWREPAPASSFHPQFNHVLPKMEWKLPVHEALLTAPRRREQYLLRFRHHVPSPQ